MRVDIEATLIKVGKMLLPILGSMLLAVATDLIPVQVLNSINVTLWAKISAVLVGLCLYLSAWVAYLLFKNKKKPNFKPFIHKPDKGYWQHVETEEKICATCKLDNALSPLHRYNGGWRCPKHPTTVGRDVTESEPPTSPNYHMI